MVSREKLVDGNLASIIQMLCDTVYGEHNIVLYPSLESFREIYTHFAKARIENNNDKVVLFPHYETAKAVEQAFRELDIVTRDLIFKGALEIIDSQHGFFDPAQDFSRLVEGTTEEAVKNGKSGAIFISDMGSFFHRQELERLVSHECAIKPQGNASRFSIFCCYHQKDFQKMTKAQEAKMCENHYRNMLVRESRD
jgi:hypothetical protein